MIFYNIHTHDLEARNNEVRIYNLSLEDISSHTIPTQKDSDFYLSAGIHPWYADNMQISTDVLSSFLRVNSKCIALGEIGLDKLCNLPIDLQTNIFEQQIKLATELQLPIIIHCVKAWTELHALYKKYKPSNPWVIHGFRGKKDLAKQLTDLGLYLSFGQYYNQEALVAIPKNRILTETDMTSVPIEIIYSRLANDLNLNIEELGCCIEQNVKLVFEI